MKSSPGSTPASGTMPPEVPRRNLGIPIEARPLTWGGVSAGWRREAVKTKSARHIVTSAGFTWASIAPRSGPRGLVHSGCTELVLDALEVIEPLDGVIELVPFLLGELRFHLGNRLGELRPIDILYRGGDVGEHGEAILRHFRKAAEHDDLLVRATRVDGQDARADRSHDRRVSGEHAEIAFQAGNVNLIDFAG